MTNDWTTVRRLHGAALARVVGSYAPPGADRDDLGQEVALAVVRALPRFRGDSSLKTYVLRIAHNVGARHAALRSRRRGEDLDDSLDERAGPEALLIQQDERSRLQAAIRTLPVAQRQVLTLALEDLSHEEIAHTLGISVNAVATRLHRARTQLKTLMGGRR